MKEIIISILAIFIILDLLSPAQSSEKAYTARVTYVIDGDTFVLDGQRARIRIWGINTPEIGKNGAREATRALQRMILGQRVKVLPKGQDRYGRQVAQVFIRGHDVGAELLRRGLAEEYKGFSKGYYSKGR